MYWFAYIVSFVFFRVMLPCKVIHKERITDGGMIFIANHTTNFDGIYLAEYLPYRKHYFLGKKEMFKNKIIGKFMKSIGGIPVDRQKADISAIKESMKVLKNGKKLIIFPEGTRNKQNDDLQEIKNGAAMLAIKTQVPLVPIYLGRRGKIFKKQIMLVGNQFELSEFYGQKTSSEVLAKAGEVITQKLHETEAELKQITQKSSKAKNK